ncbi:MAG: DUF4340 domain-containing protein [Candidatus Cloacimonadales bacterium]|nr:DUF4340 domain-containing protein [Candidatus Cloacimonadota bacterium]MDX9977946.1 DUF4340 domain-containing protein [Candidatus Cloacimonadales bacterium]
MSKKTLIMIVIAIVLLLLFIVFSAHEPIEKSIPAFSFDMSAIKQIEISADADTVQLKKINNKWMVTSINYPANEDRVLLFIDNLLQSKRLVKPLTKDSFKHYEYRITDDTGTHIRLLGDNDYLIADFYLGISSFYAYSSLRFINEDAVYELDSNLSEFLYPNLQMWKDPYIVRLKPTDILELKVSSQRNNYHLKRTEKEWEYISKDETFLVYSSNRTLYKILNVLQYIQSTTTYENTEENMKQYAKRKIMDLDLTLKNGEEYSFSAYEYDKENCILSCSSNPNYLFILNYDFTNRFTRGADNFKDYSNLTY